MPEVGNRRATPRPSDRTRDPDQSGAPVSPVASGKLSELLAELAHVPEATLDSAWSHLPRAGDVLGRYELVREIGRGGFGIVFEARDRDLGRAVAVKIVRPTARSGPAADALEREADAAARLQHPNVVTLHDAGRWEGGAYLVYEHLKGETLEDRLARELRLPLAEAIRIAREVARALAHAHGAGVVHRDLKPSNVFLEAAGRVKLLDLGLARVYGAAGPKSGTPGFMAPEQWRGDAEDARTDVFAWGVLVRLMVAGEAPSAARDGADVRSPTPWLPLAATGAPARLRRLVDAAVARDPALRPRDGRALVDALAEIERALDPRRGRTRALVALSALGGAGLAALVWARARPVQPPDPIRVAVADVANETGEAELDALSGLLLTSLEQSRHLRVLPRVRVLDVLRDAGREPARIDAASAREASRRAGVRALLLPAVRRLDRGYRVEVAAIDPASDAPLFAVHEETTGRAEIPGLVDRMADRARAALAEREEEIRANRTDTGTVVKSLEAYRHYSEGENCIDRPSGGRSWSQLDCRGHFEAALAIDPGFALAHYQLARLAGIEYAPIEEQRAALAPALETSDRLPPKERGLVAAWKAHLDGDDAAALRRYRELAAAFPEDKQPAFRVADLHHHRGELVPAVQWLERVLELDPESEFALDHVVTDLGLLGERDRLRTLAAAWDRRPRTPAILHALVRARGWSGDLPAALAAARVAATAGGGPAREDLFYALVFSGEAREAEKEIQRPAQGPGGSARNARRLLALALAYEGRLGAARDEMAALEPGAESHGARLSLHLARAHLLAGLGDAAGLRREAAALGAFDRENAANLAIHLAYAGDLEGAARLASGLPRGSSEATLYEALVAWRQGDPVLAAERLRPLAASGSGTAPVPLDVPAFLLAEALADAGRDAEALAALERYQAMYVPGNWWRPWALQRSRLLAARAAERLGRRDEALAHVDRLLADWRRADATIGDLREARALRARLEATPARRDSPGAGKAR